MATYLQKMIFTTFILSMAVPIRSESDDTTEQFLRDICSEIDRSDACWDTLKPELPTFTASNDRDVVAGVIDLATAKSRAIGDKLTRWFSESDNEDLKEKYSSCAENYSNAGLSLEKARRELDSGDCGGITAEIDEAGEELEKCKRVFGSESFDPAHVGNRNNELQLYLDIVRVAAGRLE